MYDILINSMAVKVKQKIKKTKKSNRIKSACLYGYFRRFQHGHFLKTLYFFFQACGTTKKEKRLLASAMENLLQWQFEKYENNLLNTFPLIPNHTEDLSDSIPTNLGNEQIRKDDC